MTKEITKTFPNIFTSDNNSSKSKLEYNFNPSNELIHEPQGLNKQINSPYYFKTAVLLENKNVKYNSKAYTFNGFYVSDMADLVDTESGEDYYLILENVIQTTNNYLYVCIPILEYTHDTPINKMLSTLLTGESHELTSNELNLNEMIPQSFFYSYDATNNSITNSKLNATWILFNTSSLRANYERLNKFDFNEQKDISELSKYKLIDDIYYFKVGPPLSLSTSKPKKQDTLTEYVKDEVYMQCDEVQDTKSAPKKLFYYNLFNADKLTDKANLSLDGGLMEMVVYIVILLIIGYGLYRGSTGN
jgi:hypothetical protein